MKGIILAGGKGTRLYPATLGVSKQLIPVYNKPMVYYPLTTLMMAGVQEILVITTPEDGDAYRRLLGTGSQWGLRLKYASQDSPRGLADAFIVGRGFLGDRSTAALVLGDNIFFGHDVPKVVAEAAEAVNSGACGASIFGYPVKDPERYGVVEMDASGTALSLEEKPKSPRSKLAVPGLYFYDASVCRRAEVLSPSARGEIEITDLNRNYLEERRLKVFQFGRGTAWLDAGLHESLLQASNFIQAVEDRQGMMVGCPEEVAYRMGFITRHDLILLADKYGDGAYGEYLRGID